MARAHVVFLQAQGVTWRRGLYGVRSDVETKMLSIDGKKGDSTCIVRYPKGWSRRTPEYLTAHEEFFVLEGAISINGVDYRQHAYGFHPAGHVRTQASSKAGCVLLQTFSATPRLGTGKPPRGLFDRKLLVEHLDTLSMPWDPSLVDPQLAAGVAIKPLRTDPYTGETSFLYSSAAHRVPKDELKPKWTHSMIEEIFVIDGEYVWGDCGVMGPGGYVYWRERVWHGPSGSIAGFNLWVRTIGGPMENIFQKKKWRMDWNPPFRPQIPKELRKVAKPYVRPKNY